MYKIKKIPKSDCTNNSRGLSTEFRNEEIFITGISGSFPESRNMYEFRDNLYNKVDMVTADTRRWDLKHPEIPERAGKVHDVAKFDAGFFGMFLLSSLAKIFEK